MTNKTDELTIGRTFNFNTLNTIACVADKGVVDEALALCGRFEEVFSRFIPGSDVWRLNNEPGLRLEELSGHMQAVMACADAVHAASGGAFDVRVQGFVDLGGIAKGYACDQVAAFLRLHGVQHGLLNFGGNIVTIGSKPTGEPWQVGLQSPDSERDAAVFGQLASVDSAVVTSGVYERAEVVDGVLMHHIIDPRTGASSRSDVVSATVVAAESMLADALATACVVMGSGDALELLEGQGVAGVMVSGSGEISATPGLDVRLYDGGRKVNVRIASKGQAD
jgi:thiamine biosynthesis lipoprotein